MRGSMGLIVSSHPTTQDKIGYYKSQTNIYFQSVLIIGTQFYNDVVHGRNKLEINNHLNRLVLLSFIFSCYNAICYYRNKGNVGICWIYHQRIVGRTRSRTLPFCFDSLLITPCSQEERYQALPAFMITMFWSRGARL